MNVHRKIRVEKRILQLVSDLYFREFHNPDIGFTTFTNCDLSRDCSYAKIFISIYEIQADQIEEIKIKTLKSLKRYVPFIRTRIAKNIRMKKIPYIYFEFDDSLVKAQRMEEILGL